MARSAVLFPAPRLAARTGSHPRDPAGGGDSDPRPPVLSNSVGGGGGLGAPLYNAGGGFGAHSRATRITRSPNGHRKVAESATFSAIPRKGDGSRTPAGHPGRTPGVTVAYGRTRDLKSHARGPNSCDRLDVSGSPVTAALNLLSRGCLIANRGPEAYSFSGS